MLTLNEKTPKLPMPDNGMGSFFREKAGADFPLFLPKKQQVLSKKKPKILQVQAAIPS